MWYLCIVTLFIVCCERAAVSVSSYSGSVCFRFCSDGKSLQRATSLQRQRDRQAVCGWGRSEGNTVRQWDEKQFSSPGSSPPLFSSSSPRGEQRVRNNSQSARYWKVCCQLSPPLYPVVPDTARNVHIIAEFCVQTRAWRMRERIVSYVKLFCGNLKSLTLLPELPPDKWDQ